MVKPKEVHSNYLKALGIALAVLGVASVAASLLPKPHFWGIDSCRVLPLSVRVILVAIIVVLAVPGAARALGRRLTTLDSKMKEPVQRAFAVFAIVAIFASFMWLASENHLLGDGYNIMGLLKEGGIVAPTEPLGSALHSALAATLSVREPDRWAYAITSLACGLAFLIVLFLRASKASSFFAALAVAGTFGIMQFFYGYVENYTIPFVLLFSFMLSSMRDLERRRISVPSLLLFVLAAGFHLTALALTPALVYLVWNRFRTRRALVVGIAAALVILATGAIILCSTTTEMWRLSNAFVPFVASADNPYHLLSWAHLRDLINIALLAFPMIIMIPLALRLVRTPLRHFILLAIIPAAAAAAAISPHLGAFRDWDLLSLPAAPILAALIFSLESIPRAQAPLRNGLIVALAAFSILHTGSWVMENRDRDGSYAKMKAIIHTEPQYTAAYFGGFRLKPWAFLVMEQFSDTTEAIRAGEIRHAANHNDAVNATRLARYYMERGRGPEAIRLVTDNWRNYLGSEESIAEMGSIMMENRRFVDAEQIYRAYIGRGYPRYDAYNNLGYILAMRNKIDSAYIYFELAMEHRKDKPLELELKYCGNCLKLGYIDKALKSADRLRKMVRSERLPIVDQIALAIQSGKIAKADTLLKLLGPGMPAGVH